MKLKIFKILIEYLIQFGSKGFGLFYKVFFSKKAEMVIKLPFFNHPFYMRRGTSDLEVFNQIFLTKEYKFSNKINDTGIGYIIDCGANIGLSALYFSHAYPKAKIIAVELEKSNFELLKKNVANFPNIIPIHAGVWHTNTELNIANMDDDSKFGFIAEEAGATTAKSGRSEMVEGLTIQAIMERYSLPQIDILKVDIESAEKELFELSDLSFLDKTRIILVEFHDWMKPGCSKVFFKAIEPYQYLCMCKGENLSCEIYHKS